MDGQLVFSLSIAELVRKHGSLFMRSELNGCNFVEAERLRLKESVSRGPTPLHRAHNPKCGSK